MIEDDDGMGPTFPLNGREVVYQYRNEWYGGKVEAHRSDTDSFRVRLLKPLPNGEEVVWIDVEDFGTSWRYPFPRMTTRPITRIEDELRP